MTENEVSRKTPANRCLGRVAGHPMGLWIPRLGFDPRPGPHTNTSILHVVFAVSLVDRYFYILTVLQ